MATKVNHGEIETYFKLVFLAFRWLATRINALLGRWVDQQVDLLSRIHFFISTRETVLTEFRREALMKNVRMCDEVG